MGRRIAILVILLLGLALAALFAFRTAIVELAIANRLAARGIAVGAIEVAEIGLSELRIEGLRLGARDELAARELRIAYQPGDLVQGRIEQVSIEGLVLKLDLTGAAAPLGSLQALVANREGGAPGPLPVIQLSDARIEAATPFGPVTAALDGEAWPEDTGEIAGAFSFTLESAQGRLTGAFDLNRTAAGALTGYLVVEDGVLSLPGAEAAGLLGEAGYALIPGRPPKLDAWLSAARIALPGAALLGAALEEARVDLRAVEKTAELTARLGGAGRAWSLALTATLEDYLAAPSVRFDMTGEAEAGAALWPLLALPDPAAGMVIVRAKVAGGLAPFSELGGDGATVVDWLARATLEGQVAATLGGLTYPERVETVSGRLRIAATLEDGALTYRSAAPTRLVLANLAPDWLRGLGLPAPAVALLERGVSLSLKAQGKGDRNGLAGPVSLTLKTPGGTELDATSQIGIEVGQDLAIKRLNLDQLWVRVRRVPLPGFLLDELQVVGALAGSPPALTGTLDLRLNAADIAVQGLRAAAAQVVLPVSVRIAPNSYSLNLRDRGRLSLEMAGYGDTLRLEAPLQAILRQASATLARTPAGAISLDYEATLAVEPVALVLARKEGDVTVRVAPGPIAIAGTWSPDAPIRATARLADTTLVLPDQEIAAEGLAGRFDLGSPPERIRAEFTLRALEHRAAAPLFAPLAVTGTLHGDRALAFSAEARAPGGTARLRVTGSHDTATGRGRAEIVLDPLTFDPGGLQPGALAPPLADLHDVSGGLQAEAALAWAPGEMNGAARLRLDDLSFDSDAAAVQGLDLDLRLDRLFPPGSPADQRLSVRRIDPGVALDDIDVRFQVRPGAPTRLAIERGALSVSGGRLLLRDLLLDPAAERQDLVLEVDGLALAELFRILDVEGLSGTGRLSGRIPIALVGEAVIVEAGRLEAEAPGRLRFRSEQAARALAGAGESADLMLRVLQNFHYDELSLTIDKPAETDARLALVLLGQNPDVLDGYPFRLNINLEGEVGPLVEALSQAYSLSNRMLRRVWRPGQ